MNACQSCYGTFFDPGAFPISPVPEILGTWAVPSPSEEENIRHTLGETRQAIQALEAKINNLNMIVYALDKRKAELENFYNSHNLLISAWQRVPSEIWVYIFLQCLPLYARRWNYSSAGFHPGSVPLILLRVCKRWREIALGTPKLWAYFALNKKTAYYLQKLDSQLPTRRECALSIDLSIPPPRDTMIPEPFANEVHRRHEHLPLDHPVVTDILSKSRNWEHLTLYCRVDEKLRDLAPRMNNLPRLRSLQLSCDEESVPLSDGLKLFSDAPLLREVRLRLQPSLLPVLSLPWNQLISLSLDIGASFSQWHAIIASSHQLIHLNLVVLARVPIDMESSKILLPRLRDLEIRTRPYSTEGYGDAMSIILRRLSCSLLQECKLIGATTNQDGAVQKFLGDVNETLTKFHTSWDGKFKRKGEVSLWLGAVTNITELTLDEWMGHDTTTDLLTEVVEGTYSFLVPNLKRLRIAYGKSEPAILDMLRRRVEEYTSSPSPRVNTQLESIRLTLSGDAPDPEFIAGLRALEEYGLVVVLLAPQPRRPSPPRLPIADPEDLFNRVKYI